MSQKQDHLLTPRLVGYHFPEKIPAEKKSKNPQKRCKVCYKHGIRMQTRYQCKTCTDHSGLCPHKLFMKSVNDGVSWPINVEIKSGSNLYRLIGRNWNASYFQERETHITSSKYEDIRELELKVRQQRWWEIILVNKGPRYNDFWSRGDTRNFPSQAQFSQFWNKGQRRFHTPSHVVKGNRCFRKNFHTKGILNKPERRCLKSTVVKTALIKEKEGTSVPELKGMLEARFKELFGKTSTITNNNGIIKDHKKMNDLSQENISEIQDQEVMDAIPNEQGSRRVRKRSLSSSSTSSSSSDSSSSSSSSQTSSLPSKMQLE
ncbi:hypothetical protein Avbf_09141 [Armadillidium vulgare]|nr:hypothetical protein Avbf_09141 [Armadillidium vulgare]